jgi:hypothetical protein
MNIDHIAHAVPNIDEAIVAYKKSFNVPISEVMIVEKQNIKMAIISFENLKIELMEPLNDKKKIQKAVFIITVYPLTISKEHTMSIKKVV